ncbi:hypothetical protein ABIC37_005534 [Priestia megaterium]|jgi:hypothetical protein|uniref:hypothetical protein n=1 Tax=Priestia megaterium TaxID=1404 RepID=UPI000472B7CE|nr:hypothetical protein [Priestia megaterium]MCM3186012.1 hypothetical protein [Priestia megaterium]PFB04423.1 hypothetical protein CN383_06755 [Priestia megaterium]TCN04217.1 hypothetical protein EV581_12423 [Bacillus sp. BK006]
MKKELLFESYVFLFKIEITLVSIIEKEMTTHYGHLWRQIFFAEGGTHLCDNLPLLFRLNLLQDIFTDHELHDLWILVDIKNSLNQKLTISQDDFDRLKYFSHQLNRKKSLSLSI